MDFIGGALPNVMFIVGIIAIGIGLGLEFKIIEIQGQLDRTGRITVLVVGTILIITSVVLYIHPIFTAARPAAPATAVAQSSPVTANSGVVQGTPLAAATVVPTLPAATSISTVVLPDLRGLSVKDATKRLKELGLQLGEQREQCEDFGAGVAIAQDVKKDRVTCQSVAPGEVAPLGSQIDYVLNDK